jgi:hypothetical protein
MTFAESRRPLPGFACPAGTTVGAVRAPAGGRWLAVALGIIVLAADPSRAFTLARPTFSGGAVATTGGSFRLGATLGEAGPVGATAGGGFRLSEGFWHAGAGVVSAVTDPANDPPPGDPGLVQLLNEHAGNAPNPFGPHTTVRFAVAAPSRVELAIFTAEGRRVRTVLDSSLPAGRHQIDWDGRDDAGRELGPGVYFGRLSIGAWSTARAMLRVR